jgi:hypothetical protein
LRNRNSFSEEQADQIRNDPTTMHLFAYNRDIDKFNKDELTKINTPFNPVAKLIPVYSKTNNPSFKARAAHFDLKGDKMGVTYVGRDSKVEIKGRNIAPQFGLYNGAMGIVVDIVFNSNESPLAGNMPRYILVYFPEYSGPQFFSHLSNVVPIVPVSSICQYKCCTRIFMPLNLCYAKTIHKFQGQSAGPVAPNQQPNAIQKIIIHVGKRQFEGKNAGLTYTAFSRGTSLGDLVDVKTSAIFLDGPDIEINRFVDIARSPITKKIYRLVDLRNQWVLFLRNHTVKSDLDHEQQQRLFNWADNFRPNTHQIRAFFKNFNQLP